MAEVKTLLDVVDFKRPATVVATLTPEELLIIRHALRWQIGILRTYQVGNRGDKERQDALKVTQHVSEKLEVTRKLDTVFKLVKE